MRRRQRFEVALRRTHVTLLNVHGQANGGAAPNRARGKAVTLAVEPEQPQAHTHRPIPDMKRRKHEPHDLHASASTCRALRLARAARANQATIRMSTGPRSHSPPSATTGPTRRKRQHCHGRIAVALTATGPLAAAADTRSGDRATAGWHRGLAAPQRQVEAAAGVAACVTRRE